MASFELEALFENITPVPHNDESKVQNWMYLTEVLRIMGESIRVKRCTATETWTDDTTPYVGVADDDTGDTFNLLLPRVAGKDPNVRSGNSFFYKTYNSGYYPESDGYLDDKIGTIKHWALDSGDIPQGWALANGVANSVGNGGTGQDLTGNFLKWSATALQTGSSDTGSGGGFSGNTDSAATGLTVDTEVLTTDSSTTGLTVVDYTGSSGLESTGITIDDHKGFSTDAAYTGITATDNKSITTSSEYTGITTTDNFDLEYTGLESTGLTIQSASTGCTIKQAMTSSMVPYDSGSAWYVEVDDPTHTHSTSESDHKHTIDEHKHDITDVTHYHTNTHYHAITDKTHIHTLPTMSHTVNESDHKHTINHGHAVLDPGHTHGADHDHSVTDPEHLHALTIAAHTHTAGEPPYVTLIPIERIH